MKCLLLALLAVVAVATAVDGKRLKMRPLTAREVYRALRDAGRADAIPQGRLITDGVAVVTGKARAVPPNRGQSKVAPRGRKRSKTTSKQLNELSAGKSFNGFWGSSTSNNGIDHPQYEPVTPPPRPYRPHEFDSLYDPYYNPYDRYYGIPDFYLQSFGQGSSGQGSSGSGSGQHESHPNNGHLNSIYNMKMSALSNLFGAYQDGVKAGNGLHFETEKICFRTQDPHPPRPTRPTRPPRPTRPTHRPKPRPTRPRERKAGRGRRGRRHGRQAAETEVGIRRKFPVTILTAAAVEHPSTLTIEDGAIDVDNPVTNGVTEETETDPEEVDSGVTNGADLTETIPSDPDEVDNSVTGTGPGTITIPTGPPVRPPPTRPPPPRPPPGRPGHGQIVCIIIQKPVLTGKPSRSYRH